jgi:hypothetical protein
LIQIQLTLQAIGMWVHLQTAVLGRRAVPQGRVAVSVVVLLLEVADHHAGLEQL